MRCSVFWAQTASSLHIRVCFTYCTCVCVCANVYLRVLIWWKQVSARQWRSDKRNSFGRVTLRCAYITLFTSPFNANSFSAKIVKKRTKIMATCMCVPLFPLLRYSFHILLLTFSNSCGWEIAYGSTYYSDCCSHSYAFRQILARICLECTVSGLSAVH